MIKREYLNGNSTTLKTRKVGSDVCIIVKAITGKGLHSKYGKSVLKPAVIDWVGRNNLQCTVNE